MIDFEIEGYSEYLAVPMPDGGEKLLGMRRIEKPEGREFGVYGRREYTLTEPLTLQKGYKQVTIKATPQKPIKCVGYAHIICGRLKR